MAVRCNLNLVNLFIDYFSFWLAIDALELIFNHFYILGGIQTYASFRVFIYEESPEIFLYVT